MTFYLPVPVDNANCDPQMTLAPSSPTHGVGHSGLDSVRLVRSLPHDGVGHSVLDSVRLWFGLCQNMMVWDTVE